MPIKSVIRNSQKKRKTSKRIEKPKGSLKLQTTKNSEIRKKPEKSESQKAENFKRNQKCRKKTKTAEFVGVE